MSTRHRPARLCLAVAALLVLGAGGDAAARPEDGRLELVTMRVQQGSGDDGWNELTHWTDHRARDRRGVDLGRRRRQVRAVEPEGAAGSLTVPGRGQRSTCPTASETSPPSREPRLRLPQ